MTLDALLTEAAHRAGSNRALAAALDESEQNLNGVRKGRRPLTDRSCALLADLLRVELGQIIAARNEARAKDEADKAFWRSRRAASWLCAAAIGGFMTTGNDATACETTVVSLAPETRTNTGIAAVPAFGIHIMRSSVRAIRRAATAIYRTLAAPLRTVRPAALNIG